MNNAQRATPRAIAIILDADLRLPVHACGSLCDTIHYLIELRGTTRIRFMFGFATSWVRTK